MKEKCKIIVAHPAQQHSYQTALAIKKAGYLHTYVTTVYNKEKSLTSLVSRFLKGDNLKRASGRKSNELEDKEVIQLCEFKGLVLLLLQRIDNSKFFYSWWNQYVIKSFNKKLEKYAIENNVDAIITYDTVSYSIFKKLNKKKSRIKKIIDMSAPNLSYMDKIFKEDINKQLNTSTEMKNELETKLYKRILRNSKKEIELADGFLVASNFSKQSLIYSNISKEKIFKCPYGNEEQEYGNIKERNKNKLTCIFVGRVTQKKGAFYFFEAINKLELNDFNFKIIGEYNSKGIYYSKYKDLYDFKGHITKDSIKQIYLNADILVFPSLADGFGLSVLEALSFGIPVICSKNAGVSDMIIDGYNGYTVNPGNADEIYEKLKWFKNNMVLLNQMSKNAYKSSLKYTWSNYYKEVKKSVEDIINM